MTEYSRYGAVGSPIVFVAALLIAARMTPLDSAPTDSLLHPLWPQQHAVASPPTVAVQTPTATTNAANPVVASRLPDFSGVTPILSHTYNLQTTLKTLIFKQPVSARYVAWECLSEQQGKQFASAAELSFLDDAGKTIPTTNAKVIFEDSQETMAEHGEASHVLDGDKNTIWHSAYTGGVVQFPHVLVIDLGHVFRLKGFQYLPRQDGPNGRVKDCRFYAQEQPFKLP